MTERGSNRVPTFCVNRAAHLREVIFPVRLAMAGVTVQHCSGLCPHLFLRLSTGKPKALGAGKAAGAHMGVLGPGASTGHCALIQIPRKGFGRRPLVALIMG